MRGLGSILNLLHFYFGVSFRLLSAQKHFTTAAFSYSLFSYMSWCVAATHSLRHHFKSFSSCVCARVVCLSVCLFVSVYVCKWFFIHLLQDPLFTNHGVKVDLSLPLCYCWNRPYAEPNGKTMVELSLLQDAYTNPCAQIFTLSF